MLTSTAAARTSVEVHAACGCRAAGGKTGSCGAAGPAPCVAAADALLAQAAAFVSAVEDRPYSTACAAAMGGTIGQHIRHTLDHFRAALESLRQGSECDRVIDYDHRARGVPMETCRSTALTEIKAVRETLASVAAEALASPVTVRVMLSEDGRTADLTSTLARELAFASHHAVHHHAIMKIIADDFGLNTPTWFGRAPSTLNFEGTTEGSGAPR